MAKNLTTSSRRRVLLNGPPGIRALSVSAIALFLIATPITGADFTEPTPESALAAPAGDLAQAYLWTEYMLETVLPYAEKGRVETLHIGSETITRKDFARHKRLYKKRNRIYREGMVERGQAFLAGTYSAEATESCARVGSFWMSLVHAGLVSAVRIDQQGADATLTVDITRMGSHSIEAAVVESSIAIAEEIAEYYSVGESKGVKITVQPDIRVLGRWHEWAYPPTRDDILDCRVELIPVGLKESLQAPEPHADEEPATSVRPAKGQSDIQPGVAISHKIFVETPIDDSSSRIVFDPRTLQGLAVEKSLHTMCELAALAAKRGVAYYRTDENVRLPDGRSSFRIFFYDSPPEGLTVAGTWVYKRPRMDADPTELVIETQNYLDFCRILRNRRLSPE